MFTTTDFIIRLALAALFGGAIGLERELRAKEAGMRTHFLVAMGRALFMILSQYGFDLALHHYASTASFDPSRIASQVVTGIGFIGAGTIIFQKHVVRGLTTAAGLWVTSAIGMTVGAGLYTLALASTILVLLCMEALNFVARRFGMKRLMVTFSTEDHATVRQILQQLQDNGVDFDSYEMHRDQQADGQQYQVTLELKIKRNNYRERVLDFVKDFNGVSIEMVE